MHEYINSNLHPIKKKNDHINYKFKYNTLT